MHMTGVDVRCLLEYLGAHRKFHNSAKIQDTKLVQLCRAIILSKYLRATSRRVPSMQHARWKKLQISSKQRKKNTSLPAQVYFQTKQHAIELVLDSNVPLAPKRIL